MIKRLNSPTRLPELASTLLVSSASHERIDDALRSWLDLVSTCRDQYLADEEALARCSHKLLASPLFATHCEYVRMQIIYSLLQEDEARPLHAIANFLLLDGRMDESVFPQMVDAGCFSRLVELIKNRRDDDRRLHRLLLELMYEMSRIERIRTSDLLQVDDVFVAYLFQMVEDLSDDLDDPYHYPVIRVLLVLNEQYMVATTAAVVDPMSPAAPLTNRVIKVLSLHGDFYRTFGENIILLLNRETETSLQLLILKLMYLVFTTKPTYEYFYTNDLHVLLDVIIRNLLDLPDESVSLRHTYLRVLYPLLAHTQLHQAPHYKRDEILRVLAILSGSGNAHFAPADETTLRLVDRVAKVGWLAVTPPSSAPASPRRLTDIAEATVTTATTTTTTSTSTTSITTAVDTRADTADLSDTAYDIYSLDGADSDAPTTVSTASTDRPTSPCKSSGGEGRSENTHVSNRVASKLLGISLTHVHSASSMASNVSVVDIAAVKEKPGVKTPSRRVDDMQLQPQPQPQPQSQPQLKADSTPDNPCGLSSSITRTPEDANPKSTRNGHSHQQQKTLQKRVLPAVPKHRHGILMRPESATANADVDSTTAAGTDGSTAPATKKLPPKAPPPRRAGRLKHAASNVNLRAAVSAAVEPSPAL